MVFCWLNSPREAHGRATYFSLEAQNHQVVLELENIPKKRAKKKLRDDGRKMKTQGKGFDSFPKCSFPRMEKNGCGGKCQSVVSLQLLQLYDDMTVFMKHPVVIPTIC